MYLVLLIGLLSLGAWILTSGLLARNRRRIRVGVGVFLVTGGFFALASFWGEMLWFDALGQGARFWTLVWTRVAIFFFGAAAGSVPVALLSRSRSAPTWALRLWPPLVGGLGGALWGLEAWQELLLFLNRAPTGLHVFLKDNPPDLVNADGSLG